ncbi:hypothetical protein TNCV_3335961 [Trichonephila clavipes]|nr:hypothetical protein TNCV_3335961 [Trichonephila clavipes]
MGFRTIRTGASKFHDNDTNASGHASSNYEKNAKVPTSSMEMEAAAHFCGKDPIKECNMRYTCILSDGDSKAFQHLMSLNIYGKVNR